MTALTLVTPPTLEPLTISEASAHLRVDSNAQEGLLLGYIASARQWCEVYTGRCFANQTWRQSWDGFLPVFRLFKAPLVSVSAITYVDTAGTTQTLGASAYQVDAESEPPRIVPAYGQSWPSCRDQLNAVQITFVAGYGSMPVPPPIRQAMRLLVGHMYENREAVAVGAQPSELPLGVEPLLFPYRVHY